MAGDIALPFSSSGYKIDALKKIPFDKVASVVAIDHDGDFVTINYRDLQPGDVILFDTDKFDPLMMPAIAVYQNQIFKNTRIARWRHVGILDDNFQVWDAMPKLDVRVRPLREVLSSLSRICVRRPLKNIDADLLRDALMQLSSKSKYKFNIDYGKGLATRLRKRIPPNKSITRSMTSDVICSEFVDRVLLRATKHQFFEKLPIVVPADYFVDDEFETINLHWCHMTKSL